MSIGKVSVHHVHAYLFHFKALVQGLIRFGQRCQGVRVYKYDLLMNSGHSDNAPLVRWMFAPLACEQCLQNILLTHVQDWSLVGSFWLVASQLSVQVLVFMLWCGCLLCVGTDAH